MEEGDEVGKRNNSSGSAPGRRSLASAVSTESGIHMGSDHDTINLNTGGDQLIMQTRKLTKMIKNVRRSHSYNVCDANKTSLKYRRAVRPKSLVHGREESSISVEELYLWQSQLKQLHLLNKHSAPTDHHIAKTKAMTKVPKKESLREKAKTLIRGLKTRRALKNKGSMSSSCTEDDPDSTSSSLDRSGASITQNISWTSKDTSDLLRILKVFAGAGLHTNSNAEYRSVLATIDSTVLEIKKQSISKYGFTDTNPINYLLVCSTGFYIDSKGNNISTPSEGFGSKSDCWKEVHAEHLLDNTRPLDLQCISEDMESARLELRYKSQPDPRLKTPSDTSLPPDTKSETVKQIKQTTGLHHYPGDSPFLILIQGFDSRLDHVIYPLSEGETLFVSLATAPRPSFTGHVIVIHTNETVDRSIMRSGNKCTICNGSKREELKCGQSFNVGKHYNFIFKEAIDNNVPSPEVGSPDTQRTLSTGTLTSLSPELNNMTTIMHQHAEPRFIFHMEHKKVLYDSIFDYDTLTNKNVLACARLTIMSLRHACEHFTRAEVGEVVAYCKDRLELLAKVVQQKAAEMLSTCPPNQKKSATSFLKPMMKLLASTLEIVHYLRENPLFTSDPIVNEIEKLAVPMYEHIAYHSAKMVYELLPSILDPAPILPISKPSLSSVDMAVSTSGSCHEAPVSSSVLSSVEEDIPASPPPTEREKRRWSVPNLAPTRKRKMTKFGTDRPRSESLAGTERELLGARSTSSPAGGSFSADEITELMMQNAVKFSGDPNSPGCRRNTARQNLTNIGAGVKVLVQLLQKFHTLSNNCKLNNAMIKQLFVSIFYFSNTTLFNTIIESPQLYFNWNKGIQMRIHLDYLLRWTHHVQLSHTSNLYFKELHQLLDLLSLPKRDLLASTWSALSKTFPNLSPAQLNHVLSNHSVSQKPRIWKPSPPLSMTSDSSIRVELTAYPQLVIPTRGYKLAHFSDLPDNLRPTLAKLTKCVVSMSQTKRSPKQTRTFQCSLQKSDSKSIGLKLKKSPQGNIRVSDIVLNSPAHLSGQIQCEDEILQINQTVVTGNSVAFCKRIIMGSEGNIELLLSRAKS